MGTVHRLSQVEQRFRVKVARTENGFSVSIEPRSSLFQCGWAFHSWISTMTFARRLSKQLQLPLDVDESHACDRQLYFPEMAAGDV